LAHDNTLIYRGKFFLCPLKHRIHDPSEILAVEFKGEFRRSAICSVSATIGIDRSIFSGRQPSLCLQFPKKDRYEASYREGCCYTGTRFSRSPPLRR
jgi:hypothetical protein